MKEIKPAIVVVAYNRTHCLKRLLKSIANAKYSSIDIPLIISIDYSGDLELVKQVADDFKWIYGEKIVIAQQNNLGLKQHVLKCGDFVNEYGAIIMLEDDLFVAPGFYEYALGALDFYKEDNNIGGISLYKHETNVNVMLPFMPLSDRYDNFFLQFASSWGQAWSKMQWSEFRSWLGENENKVFETAMLHDFVNSWPESSWLKWFNKFLVETDKYFVYPKHSFTTNYSTPGTNMKANKRVFQVELSIQNNEFNFSSIEDSNSIYDAFFEIAPKLTHACQYINSAFDVDLYNSKQLKNCKTEYILTSREIKNPLKTFGKELYPHEMNVICNVEGKDIFIGKSSDIGVGGDKLHYHYKNIGVKRLMLLLREIITQKVKTLWQ